MWKITFKKADAEVKVAYVNNGDKVKLPDDLPEDVKKWFDVNGTELTDDTTITADTTFTDCIAEGNS